MAPRRRAAEPPSRPQTAQGVCSSGHQFSRTATGAASPRTRREANLARDDRPGCPAPAAVLPLVAEDPGGAIEGRPDDHLAARARRTGRAFDHAARGRPRCPACKRRRLPSAEAPRAADKPRDHAWWRSLADGASRGGSATVMAGPRASRCFGTPGAASGAPRAASGAPRAAPGAPRAGHGYDIDAMTVRNPTRPTSSAPVPPK